MERRRRTRDFTAATFAACAACAAFALTFALTAHGGVPVAWTADAWRVKETALTAYHGETLDLAATLTAYGRPLDLAGKTARLWWTTNVTERGTAATGAAWFVTNATVKADSATGATNVLAATWYGASDTGADRIAGFIGVEGEIYRAAFTMTLRAAPGFSPAVLPLPTRLLDFGATTVTNADLAPFVVKGGAGGVDAATATNISASVTSNTVTKAYVEGLGISGGVDTNAVLALVASPAVTNAGAVAAVTKTVAENYLPLLGGYVRGSLSQGAGVTASGDYAHAEGDSTTASAQYTHAEGAYTYAVGHSTHAEGGYTQAGGYLTHAEGLGCYTYGVASHAEGYMSIASNDVAHASGRSSFATNAFSFVWQGATADGLPPYYYSHGDGTFNLNPVGGLAGLWIGETNAATYAAGFAKTNELASVVSLLNGTATRAEVAAVSNTVATWEGYWNGDIVRLAVTNYYGNTSGEPPRLRIEEAQTNGAGTVTGYRIVWDELTRQTNYQAQISAQVAATSNAVMTAAYRQTYNQLGNKAPRAWGEVTSAGEAAPANTVWITEPKLVIAGGTEYAHFAVGEGTISVLTANGQTPYTEGAEGQFRFCDESGSNYFGFDVKSAYTIGCRTDGIDIDQDTHIVTLTYDLTSENAPTIYHSTNLTEWAETEATWEENPPTGQQVCYFNVGTTPNGFYKASLSSAGGAKFLTNMQADLMGGIAATNEVLNVTQSVYPVITSTGVVWRVKQ